MHISSIRTEVLTVDRMLWVEPLGLGLGLPCIVRAVSTCCFWVVARAASCCVVMHRHLLPLDLLWKGPARDEKAIQLYPKDLGEGLKFTQQSPEDVSPGTKRRSRPLLPRRLAGLDTWPKYIHAANCL